MCWWAVGCLITRGDTKEVQPTADGFPTVTPSERQDSELSAIDRL